MASDLAIVATVPGTDVLRDRRIDVTLLNAVWLFVNGYTVDANRECIIDPDREGGASIECLGEVGFTPATRAA